MPDGWSLTIHGGFAWVFAGDSRVTVGPFRRPDDVPDYHPHEMVLRVPTGDVIGAKTSLPFRLDGNQSVFVLRDEVRLLPDGTAEPQGGLTRRKGDTDPGDHVTDSFYFVYNANRMRDGGDPGALVDDWPSLLLARLDLSNGDLTVLPSHHPTKYDLYVNGQKKHEQRLATHILYKPNSTPREVVFDTPHGRVTAQPTRFEIAADCGCVNGPGSGKIEGFDVTFKMFREPKAHLKVMPHYKAPPNAKGAAAPGPDCPPREFSI